MHVGPYDFHDAENKDVLKVIQIYFTEQCGMSQNSFHHFIRETYCQMHTETQSCSLQHAKIKVWCIFW